MTKNVLVVAAHPDDEVLGCGGVMGRHAAEGDQVSVLVVTRGAPDLYPEAWIERLLLELRAAGELLGVAGIHFLDFPAPKLDVVAGYALADGIAQVIRTVQPEMMYIPHRGDIHGDHQAVYQAALVAARPINDCPVRTILSYETLSETEWAAPTGDQAFIPTVFVDIGEHLERKLEAMACYQTQLRPAPHSRSLRTIEALARLRGATVGLAAAEAFQLVRQII
jgi:N-acetylglucosamine malate deacetylase 1